jgi:hypothetical protein
VIVYCDAELSSVTDGGEGGVVGGDPVTELG